MIFEYWGLTLFVVSIVLLTREFCFLNFATSGLKILFLLIFFVMTLAMQITRIKDLYKR